MVNRSKHWSNTVPGTCFLNPFIQVNEMDDYVLLSWTKTPGCAIHHKITVEGGKPLESKPVLEIHREYEIRRGAPEYDEEHVHVKETFVRLENGEPQVQDGVDHNERTFEKNKKANIETIAKADHKDNLEKDLEKYT